MKTIDKIVHFASLVGGGLLIGTTVFITLDVVLRYTLKISIPAVYDITQELLMVSFIYLGMASAQHVTVDFLTTRFSSSLRRKVELVALVISFIFVMTLFVGAGYMLVTSIKLGETTESELGYPLWPARLMVMVGLGLLAVVQIASFLRELKGRSS